MGFFIVAIGMAAMWVLLVMPIFGLICLALSLLFRHLYRKHMRSAPDGVGGKWRKILSIVLAVIGALNLLAGLVGWIAGLVLSASA